MVVTDTANDGCDRKDVALAGVANRGPRAFIPWAATVTPGNWMMKVSEVLFRISSTAPMPTPAFAATFLRNCATTADV